MKKRGITHKIILILGILLIFGTMQGVWADETVSEESVESEFVEQVKENETVEVIETAATIETTITSASTVSSTADNGIMLYEGWNLVATPRTLDKSENTAKIFSNVDAQGHSIWTYDTEKEGWIDLIQDDGIKPLQGYWIYSAQEQWVPFTYNTDPLMVPPSRTLTQGWNLVGLSGIHDATARDAFLSVRKLWTNIIGWDEKTQSYEPSILNGGDEGNNEMTLLSTGNAYWVFMTESGIMAALDA